MPRQTLSLVLAAVVAATVNAHSEYIARIPNGDQVPGVKALGHINPNGGGANNEFGLNFASADHVWTKSFCEEDSDQDGQTNGQELGDPCCEWVKGSNDTVRWTKGVSHPGNASSKSDPSLWASISCNASSTASTAGSGATGDVDAGSPTTSNHTSSSTPSTSTTPTAKTSGTATRTVAFSAVGILVVGTAFFI